jgi:hypothetical protein
VWSFEISSGVSHHGDFEIGSEQFKQVRQFGGRAAYVSRPAKEVEFHDGSELAVPCAVIVAAPQPI